MSDEGKPVLLPDAVTHHFNRPTPPGLFLCGVHGNHDAEEFVIVHDFEGTSALPVCFEAAGILIQQMAAGPGMREAPREDASFFQGTIHGQLSSL